MTFVLVEAVKNTNIAVYQNNKSMDQQNSDFNYFLENMGNLYQKYGNKFVAVKNQNIIGTYNNFNKAFELTVKNFSFFLGGLNIKFV
jgi:hypothetical protein